jgi:hypothetical protein
VKGRIASGFHRTTCSIEAFALGLAVATLEAEIKREPAKGAQQATRTRRLRSRSQVRQRNLGESSSERLLLWRPRRGLQVNAGTQNWFHRYATACDQQLRPTKSCSDVAWSPLTRFSPMNAGRSTILEQIAHLEAEAQMIRDLHKKARAGLLAKPNDPTLALQMVTLRDLLKSRLAAIEWLRRQGQKG